MQDTKSDLEQLITPTFFKEGKPLSEADIYDFIENLITKGEASANTSKVIDLLPELRNKERTYNAFNNQSTQTKEPQQLLVSKENLHTKPKAQESSLFDLGPKEKLQTEAIKQYLQAFSKHLSDQAKQQIPSVLKEIDSFTNINDIVQYTGAFKKEIQQFIPYLETKEKLEQVLQTPKLQRDPKENLEVSITRIDEKPSKIHLGFDEKGYIPYDTHIAEEFLKQPTTNKDTSTLIDTLIKGAYKKAQKDLSDKYLLDLTGSKIDFGEDITLLNGRELYYKDKQINNEYRSPNVLINTAKKLKEGLTDSDLYLAHANKDNLANYHYSYNLLNEYLEDISLLSDWGLVDLLVDKSIKQPFNQALDKAFKANGEPFGVLWNNEATKKNLEQNLADYGISINPKDFFVGKNAIDFLLDKQSGYIQSAFHKENLGDIDLVWGEITDPKNHKGYGLAHILDKHPDFDIRLIPEIIEKGNLINQNNIRYRIEKDNYVIGLSAEYKGDKRNFIITAFEKNKDKRDTFTEHPFTSTSDNAVKNLDKKENAESLYASSAITKGETLPLNSKANSTKKEQSKQHKGQEELKNIFDEFEQQDKTLQDKAKLLKEHKEDLRSKDLVGSEKWEDLIKQQSLLIDEESQILERAYKKAKRLMPHFSSYEEILQYEPINSVSLRLLKENVNEIMDKEIRALQDTSITKADFKQALDEFNTFYKEYRDYHKPLYYEFETKFGFYTREFNKNKLSNAKDVEMFKKYFLDKKPSAFNDKLKQVYETIQQYNQLELQNRQRIHDSKESELIKSKAIEIKEQLNNKYKNSIQKQEISKQSENPHAQNLDQKRTKGKIPDEIKGDTTNLSAYSGLGDKATGELKQEIENLRKEINDLQKKRIDEEEAHPKAKELDRLRDEYYDEFSKAQTKEQKEIIREKYYSKIDPLANEIDNELPSHKKIIEKQKELNNAQEILEAKEKAIQEAKLKADPKMLEKEYNARSARASLTTIRNNPEDVLSEERYFDNARLLDKNFRANTHRWARENGLKDEINTARRFIIGEAERNEAIQRATELQGELITKQRNYFSAKLAKQRAELEKELDITPIKEFGTNYAEFYHAGGDAVKKLLLEKQGQVAGAFYKDGLGDIDVVWGDSNFGLKHILDKHGGEFKDIAKELDAIVENGAVVKTHNGYNITLGDYKVGLNIGWNENGVKIGENKWVVTAFDNSKLQSEKQGSNSASFTKGETLPLNSEDIIPQTQSKATTQETTNTQGPQTFNPTKFVLGFADELAGFGILTRTRALSKIDDYVQRQLSKNQDLANNPAELERTLRNDMNSKINQAKQRLKAEENKGIHNANEVDFKNPPKERTLFDFLDEDAQKEATQPKEYNIYNLPPKAPQPNDESSIKLVDKDTIQTISIDKDTQEAITKTEIRDLQLPSAKLEGENFHFEPYDEVINPKQRIQNNIKAIEILQDLQKNPRELSNEQKSILNSYSGFGGLSSAFREGSESLAKLESLLDTTTLKNLKGTILDAYYTPTHIIKGIYQALEDFLPKVLVPF